MNRIAMLMKITKLLARLGLAAILLSTLNFQLSTALAQGTAFTYQGRLNDGANPAHGSYDLRFTIYDSANNTGTVVAGPLTNVPTAVSNGLFTVALDFGAGVFTGAERWLEIGVRPAGSASAFTLLAPRQPVTPVPYALYAASGNPGPKGETGATGPQGIQGADGSAGAKGDKGEIGPAGATGATGPQGPAGPQGITGAPGAAGAKGDKGDKGDIGFTGATGATGPPGAQGLIGQTGAEGATGPAGAKGDMGDKGDSGPAGAAGPQGPQGPPGTPGSANGWAHTGDAGTTAGKDFLGTTDNQPLEFKINNQRGLRLEYQDNGLNQSVNIIGGYSSNQVSSGLVGATISGGGGLNAIAGSTPNRVNADFGTVGGGGQNTSGGWATVGGGGYNTAGGDYATVPGGFGNTAIDYAFAAGNRAKANHRGAFVWADAQNADFVSTANNQFNVRAAGGVRFVTGGLGLTADGPVTATSFVGNGSGLTGLAPLAALDGLWKIGGNGGTTPGANFLGTTDNQPLEFKINNQRILRLESATSPFGGSGLNVIGGWAENVVASGMFGATIAGGGTKGHPNQVTSIYGTVGGGAANTAGGQGEGSTVGGGYQNTSSDYYTTVAGGQYNNATDQNATVAGGAQNTASGQSATVGGGGYNVASGRSATIPGGENNVASGQSATIPGGDNNLASGNYSFAAGHSARAIHPGAFVWADSPLAEFASTADNQFLIRASGGVGIGTASPASELHVVGSGDTEVSLQSAANNRRWTMQASGGTDGVGLGGSFQIIDRTAKAARMIITTAGNVNLSGTVTATAFNTSSDRHLKENLTPVNPREVLDKVAAMPVTRWNFKEDATTTHLGPMAQDFHAAFGLGEDDRHITTVDADGVALAAIQGLNQKLEEREASLRSENAQLKQQNTELERRLAALEKLMNHPAVTKGAE